MELASGKTFLLATSFLAISLAAGDTHANDALVAASSASGDAPADSDATPRVIDWSFLAPENGRPFNDPFSKLDRDQDGMTWKNTLVPSAQIPAHSGRGKSFADPVALD